MKTKTLKQTYNSAALFLFSVALLLAGGAPAVRGQSALDGFDPNANGPIDIVVVQPDGKILIGGDFTTLSPNGGTTITRNRIARLNPDGTLDIAFNPNADGYALSIAVQADGKILVGGVFSNIGGQPRNSIARLDATTGVADPDFNPNPNSPNAPYVFSMAVQPDGKILVGGYFTSIGGQPRNHIARLNPDGTLDIAFNPNAESDVHAIAVQADGKILVGGYFSNIGGQPRNHIAQLDATTGVADPDFNPNANNTVDAITAQADGKILVGGYFSNIGGQPRLSIARLNPNGSLDAFDPHAGFFKDGEVRSIAVQADGKILVGGNFESIGGQSRNLIARLDPTTALADSFDPNPNGNGASVNSIAVQADGKILVGGFFTTLAPNGGAPVTRNNIARLETDGRLDQTLNLSIEGGGGIVHANAVQPDGKILIGGLFTTVLGVPRSNIARLHTDGTMDTAFAPNANGEVKNVAVQADGKILVAGSFSGANSIGEQSRNLIARLDATTGLADSFDPNASGVSVLSIMSQEDGKVLFGGDFTAVSPNGGPQVTRNRIARVNLDGTLDTAFNPDANGIVRLVAVVPGDKILAGGNFTSIGGQLRNGIARLDATTGLADSCNPDATGGGRVVFAFALQADGKYLVGGYFTGIGGQMRNFIARLDPTTCLADEFNPDPNSTVDSIAVQADGKILVGGLFTSIGGLTRNRIARLDPTTAVPDSFDPNATGGFANSITLQADGKLRAGGTFTSMGGQPRNLFARLSNDTAALQNLTATQTTVTWTRGGSSQQFTRVTFESSTDNVNYTSLGNGTPQNGSSDWVLTGLSLPTGQNIYVRARGFYRSGYGNGSDSLVESVRNAYLTGPAGTPSPTPTGTPTPTATATATPIATPTPILTPTPSPAAQALNLSTRMRVETGERVGIGGIIITGTQPKRVIVRAIGPSLTAFGVEDAMADPVLELHGPGGFTTIINNDWRSDQEAEIQATGLAPTNNLESAIVKDLAPGNYTAIVRGNNDTTGVALVEAYDLSSETSTSKLGNISTRAFVSTGANIVIAGFILGNGTVSDQVIIRGIGPSLTTVGVTDALADPTLELRNNNGVVLVSNDNWQDDPSQAAIISAAGLAPSNPLESGIAWTLAPGTYTALLAGKYNGVGTGLVEVYSLP